MKSLSRYTVLFISVCTLSTAIAEPTNIQVTKNQLMRYVSSGKYAEELQQVDNAAERDLVSAIKKNTKLRQPQKLALVLDIDETSLSGYPDLVALNFGGSIAEIQKREARGREDAIASTLQLYNFAKQNQVAVFFITGRPTWMRPATIRNLHTAGYNNWDGLTFKTTPYQGMSAGTYKATIRKQIEDKGYVIVANVGDQQSDLTGGYAEEGYKLPNPFYYIP